MHIAMKWIGLKLKWISEYIDWLEDVNDCKLMQCVIQIHYSILNCIVYTNTK